MSFIWNTPFIIGDKELDDQHEELFRLFNKVLVSSKEALANNIEELINYADFHFSFEETLMARLDYPNAEAHKRGHKILRDRLIASSKDPKLDFAGLERFFYKWALWHIPLFDGRLIIFANNADGTINNTNIEDILNNAFDNT